MGENIFFKAARYTVSADKNRYVGAAPQNHGVGNAGSGIGSWSGSTFDLDLTYITERIVAMAFPADGVESAFRNNIDRVAELFRTQHGEHFLIYNLTSERLYDYDKFNRQVITWCGFPDHNPPPLPLLFRIVHSMYAWLSADPRNVAAIHCLAGKGRTGTVIACFFLFSGLFARPMDALNFFGVRRSHNNWGVTGPSQLRYVGYFSQVYTSQQVPSEEPLILANIALNGVPAFNVAPGKQGCCPFFEIYSVPQLDLLFSSEEGHDRELNVYLTSQRSISITCKALLPSTDLLVTFKHVTPLYGTELMFHFGFNLGMVTGTPRQLRIERAGLDKAYKDPRFAIDFAVTLTFRDVLTPSALSPTFEGAAANSSSPTPKIPITLMTLAPEPPAEPSRRGSVAEPEAFLLSPATGSGAPMSLRKYIQIKPNLTVPGSICFHPSNLNRKLALARDIGIPTRGKIAEKGGFLIKQGHVRKTWKRRWFALHCSSLAYMKSPRDSNAAGTIQLDNIESISMTEFSIKGKRVEGFLLCTILPQKAFAITADDRETLQEWHDAIQHARTLATVSSKPLAGGELCCQVAKLRNYQHLLSDDSFQSYHLVFSTRTQDFTILVSQLLASTPSGQPIELRFQIPHPELDSLSVTLWQTAQAGGLENFPSLIIGSMSVPIETIPSKANAYLRLQWFKLIPHLSPDLFCSPDLLLDLRYQSLKRKSSIPPRHLNSPDARRSKMIKWNLPNHPFDLDSNF